MLSIQDIRKLNYKDLEYELKKGINELYKIVAKIRTKKEKNNHKVKLAKKNVARIKTVMNEHKKNESLNN